MYYPAAQLDGAFLSVIVRSSRSAASLRTELIAAIHALDPGLPIDQVQPYSEVLAQASADQKIVQSRRAVEIETLKAQAEVEPLVRLADQLADLKRHGPDALRAYIRNVRLSLFDKAHQVFVESKK